MKKFLYLFCAAVILFGGCIRDRKSNQITNYDTTTDVASIYAKEAKYQIFDQEYDNLLAPDTDYDTLCAYELQACGESYLPPAAKLQSIGQIKAAARKVDTATALKQTRAKKVVNTVNIYEVDGPNPSVPVSSKTTTKVVYQDGKVVSSSTSSSGGSSSASTSSGATSTSTTTAF